MGTFVLVAVIISLIVAISFLFYDFVDERDKGFDYSVWQGVTIFLSAFFMVFACVLLAGIVTLLISNILAY